MRLTIRRLDIGRGINKRFLQPFGGTYLMDCEEMQSRSSGFKWNLIIPLIIAMLSYSVKPLHLY